ncbi:MAG: GntR family transcriptional regulator [Amphiplicatus sp.]
MSDTVIQRSSLQVEVTNRLRTEIIEGHWRPGTRLQERVLCERYGISRSPLREAYQVMASEGLLEISPNKGAVVSAPTPELTIQNFELLRALELLAIKLACRNARAAQLEDVVKADQAMKRCAANGDLHGFFKMNNEVHRRIVLASGNEPLADTHLVISRQIIRVQNLEGPIEHLASEGVDEHGGIIEALLARNEKRAVTLFGTHLDTVEDNLRSRLREFEQA